MVIVAYNFDNKKRCVHHFYVYDLYFFIIMSVFWLISKLFNFHLEFVFSLFSFYISFAHEFQKMMHILTNCPPLKGTVKLLQVLY